MKTNPSWRVTGLSLFLFSVLVTLTACGGGGNASPAPPTTAPLIFANGIINGMGFESQSDDGKQTYSGVTDNSGVAQTIVNVGNNNSHDEAPITFTIAGPYQFTLSNLAQDATVSVPQTSGPNQDVHVVPLYTILDITSDLNQITNIDTLLQTLSSTPAASGITITQKVHSATTLPSFDYKTQQLAQDILSVKAAVDAADPSVTHTIPTPAQALAHAQGSWLCAMAGYYKGSSGSNFAGPSGAAQNASMSLWILVLPNGNTVGSARFTGSGPFSNSVAALNSTIQFPSQSLTTQGTLTAPTAAPDTVTFSLVWDGPRGFDITSQWTDQNGTTGSITGSRVGIPTKPVQRFVSTPMSYTDHRGIPFTSIMSLDVDANNNVSGTMWAEAGQDPQPWAWQGTLSGNTLSAKMLSGNQGDFQFAFSGTVDPTSGNITQGTLFNYDNTPLFTVTPDNPVLHCSMNGP